MMFNGSKAFIRRGWRALLSAALFSSAVATASETRVSENREVTASLREITEDIISNWTVLESHPGGTTLLGSPSRADVTNPGFCVREVIRLSVINDGKILS